MRSQPNISYTPDYKSFTFGEANDDMKEAKPDKKGSSDDLFDLKDHIMGGGAPNSLHEANHNGNLARNPMDGKGNLREHACASNGSERRKSHCSKVGSVDCELPELVVFLQESSYNFIKDMCIDKKAHAHAKCLVENCELDHRIISCILESDDDIKHRGTRAQDDIDNNSRSGTKQPKSTNTVDDVLIDKSTKEIVPESLLLVAKTQKSALTSSMVPLTVEKNNDNSQITTSIPVPKEAEQRKTPCNNDLSTSSSSGTEELSELEQIPTGTEGGWGLSEPTSPIRQSFSEESSLFTSGHFSGLISHPGAEAPSFRSVSRCSNSSTTSSRSFAFPILGAEWHGSPERMAKPESHRQLKKRNGKCWRFLCCKF